MESELAKKLSIAGESDLLGGDDEVRGGEASASDDEGEAPASDDEIRGDEASASDDEARGDGEAPASDDEIRGDGGASASDDEAGSAPHSRSPSPVARRLRPARLARLAREGGVPALADLRAALENAHVNHPLDGEDEDEDEDEEIDVVCAGDDGALDGLDVDDVLVKIARDGASVLSFQEAQQLPLPRLCAFRGSRFPVAADASDFDVRERNHRAFGNSERHMADRFLATTLCDWEACFADLPELVVAGGSLAVFFTNWVFNREWPVNDIDVFVVGCSEAQADRVITTFLGRVWGAAPPAKTVITTSKFAMTVESRRRTTLQVIYTIAPDIATVLHGFDLGCCSVAFAPCLKKFFFTPLGALAARRGLGVVDPAWGSNPFFGHRIVKYASGRGGRAFGRPRVILFVPQLAFPEADEPQEFTLGDQVRVRALREDLPLRRVRLSLAGNELGPGAETYGAGLDVEEAGGGAFWMTRVQRGVMGLARTATGRSTSCTVFRAASQGAEHPRDFGFAAYAEHVIRAFSLAATEHRALSWMLPPGVDARAFNRTTTRLEKAVAINRTQALVFAALAAVEAGTANVRIIPEARGHAWRTATPGARFFVEDVGADARAWFTDPAGAPHFAADVALRDADLFTASGFRFAE